MFFFAHLFAGTIFGYTLARLTRDDRVLPFCMAGGILPDLIDKALGYILLPQVLDSGRTFFHALAVVALIAGTGLILWQNPGRARLSVSLAAGILLHQVLDAMWNEPVTWTFPFTGPFPPRHYEDYLMTFLWLEMTSVSEWIFLFASLLVLGCLLLFGTRPNMPVIIRQLLTDARIWYGILTALSVLCLFSLACAVFRYPNILAIRNTVEDDLLMGLTALAGCIAVFVMQKETASAPGSSR